MKAANVEEATGARFSSPPSSPLPKPFLPPLPPPSSEPLPLPFRPLSGACAKAELFTWLFTALAKSACLNSSTWKRCEPSSRGAALPPMPGPKVFAVFFRHSARSFSMMSSPPPLLGGRGAFFGSKSTHGGAGSILSVFLMPSVLHKRRLASTSLDAFQLSTSLSTLPPSTSTVSGVSNRCPFCTLNGASLVDHNNSLVPGGKCTPRAFVETYSRP
mmetsp:Transcript_87247/g.251963  ORF Transcript_87247/g.251963 Transcript_87247/m.251963 type:complete len:216 (+) Transcript_87247:478-1125(+)